MNNKRSKKLEQLIEETGHFLQMKTKIHSKFVSNRIGSGQGGHSLKHNIP